MPGSEGHDIDFGGQTVANVEYKQSRPSSAENGQVATPTFNGAEVSASLLDSSVREHLRSWMAQAGIKVRGPSNQTIVAEALRRGVHVSATRPGAVRLRGNRVFWWNNGATNLNAAAVRRISPQKEVGSRVLRARGIKAPENAVFSPGDARRAWRWADCLRPLVVKPFNASKGRGVNIGIDAWEEFEAVFVNVSQSYGDVLVEELISGTEHRFHVVDGRVTAVNRRAPANVSGDGLSSIHELVGIKNRFVAPPHVPLSLGRLELEYLAKQGLDASSVPTAGDRVYLRGTSNLSTGGDAVDATGEVSREEEQFVELAARCWPGLRAGGYDVLLPRERGDDPPTILEVNHAAGIGGHHCPRVGRSRNVAGAVLDVMFPETIP